MLTIGEVIKTFYSAILQKLKRFRGNWEQNDPEADDYIKNRPFYKRTVFDISWDGNTEGLDSVNDMLYLLSDLTPSMDDLIGAELTFSEGGITYTQQIMSHMIFQGTGCVLVYGYALIAYQENAVIEGITIPKPGVWFYKSEGEVTKSLRHVVVNPLGSEFLPEIPAEKLPEIPVIEFTQNIIDSIASDTQPSYTVKNLSYSDLLEIFNRGIFAFKDSYAMYYPLNISTDTSGDLRARILTNEVLKQSLVYATLVCTNGNTRFYRDSYRTISETTQEISE